MVSIPRCGRGDAGSIPARGICFFLSNNNPDSKQIYFISPVLSLQKSRSNWQIDTKKYFEINNQLETFQGSKKCSSQSPTTSQT